MSDMIKGGCTCGSIRYAIEGKPDYSLICQCSQCQKITGSGNAPQMAVTNESLMLEGELSSYQQFADDGNTVTNCFCPHCGSPILKKTSADDMRVYIHVGSLDDPARFEPEFVVYSDSGHAWDTVDPELKRY